MQHSSVNFQKTELKMIINVANPIYDSVFKFLVEDEYFSAIEHRDTELMVKTQKLDEMSEKLAEKDNLGEGCHRIFYLKTDIEVEGDVDECLLRNFMTTTTADTTTYTDS